MYFSLESPVKKWFLIIQMYIKYTKANDNMFWTKSRSTLRIELSCENILGISP